MSEPVSSIRNLGPKSEAGFARAGINSAEDLRALGADASYLRLIRAGTRPHFIGFYALVLGLQGRPWNDLQGEEKTAMRARFDALVARAGNEGKEISALDAQLERIGVLPAGKPRGIKPL